MKKLPFITGLLPKAECIWVACSGGIDSLFAADFLRRTRRIGLAYFNHGTDYAESAEMLVAGYAAKWNLPYARATINSTPEKNQSMEEFWRNERYEFLDSLGVVVTGHHLDDAVETWVWSSCHGQPKLPLLQRGNVYRPFLACRKTAMKEWLVKEHVTWIEDPSNEDTSYTRNRIRKEVMPHILTINPGIHTTIQNKILDIVKDEFNQIN